MNRKLKKQNRIIFNTKRLIVRPLQEGDKEAFYDLMSNPKVMHPIPQETMDRDTSNFHFAKHLNSGKMSDTKVWAIDLISGTEFIGIAAYLKNDHNEDEIGYRIREQFWGKGYGTEIAKGLIDYGFNKLKLDMVTADVNIENKRSVKILEKFFDRDIEFYNSEDKCIDRRYKCYRDQWLQ